MVGVSWAPNYTVHCCTRNRCTDHGELWSPIFTKVFAMVLCAKVHGEMRSPNFTKPAVSSASSSADPSAGSSVLSR